MKAMRWFFMYTSLKYEHYTSVLAPIILKFEMIIYKK